MNRRLVGLLYLFLILTHCVLLGQRARDYGIQIGVIPTGKYNANTDVEGEKVGQVSLQVQDSINTGVTVILPHDGNIFQDKVTAAMYLGNGFGKLMGYSQVEELGNIETPIALTNTLNVPLVANGILDYVLKEKSNEAVRSVNPIVGETNDGGLNDIRGRHVQSYHVIQAIEKAKGEAVKEGNVGAGCGTTCFGFKGGIGTASRVLPKSLGGYTVGVLVQTNFGGVLQINGVPIGQELGEYYYKTQLDEDVDGSCMIVVATDAPVDARNLKRMAKRAILGLGKTGGVASNGSGDYVIAFTTHSALRIPYQTKEKTLSQELLRNSNMTPLFMATIEATEEAIINSLFAAQTVKYKDRTVEAMPIEKVLTIMKKYNRIVKK